jgi:serine/threonine protein kinase
MALTPGPKLSPYEIQSPLGAGGMGEVYRARDTRLDRTVAVKVLTSRLSVNPELKQRFEREAKAISSPNHPNICTLHNVGSQDSVDFLVMEHLEGETNFMPRVFALPREWSRLAVQLPSVLASSGRECTGAYPEPIRSSHSVAEVSGRFEDFWERRAARRAA